MVTLEEGILRLRKQKSPFKNIDHIEELCQKKFTLSPYKIIHKGILPNKKCCIGKKRKQGQTVHMLQLFWIYIPLARLYIYIFI